MTATATQAAPKTAAQCRKISAHSPHGQCPGVSPEAVVVEPTVQAKQSASVLNGVSVGKTTGRTSTRKPAPVTVTQKPGTKAAPAAKTAKPAAKATKPAAKTPRGKKAQEPIGINLDGDPKADAKTATRDAKRALALDVVQAVSEMIAGTNLADSGWGTTFTVAEARNIASSWIHHIPADHEQWVKFLPAPDRSDWR